MIACVVLRFLVVCRLRRSFGLFGCVLVLVLGCVNSPLAVIGSVLRRVFFCRFTFGCFVGVVFDIKTRKGTPPLSQLRLQDPE